MVYKPLLAFTFVAVLLVSGCIGISPEDIVKSNPMVSQFLEDYPNAEVKVTHFTAEQAGNMLEDIRSDCENPYMEATEFYKITIEDEASGLSIISWLDWPNKRIECAVKKGTPVPRCSDGTAEGKCSPDLPKFCYLGNLVDRCSECGCPAALVCNAASGACLVPGLAEEEPPAEPEAPAEPGAPPVEPETPPEEPEPVIVAQQAPTAPTSTTNQTTAPIPSSSLSYACGNSNCERITIIVPEGQQHIVSLNGMNHTVRIVNVTSTTRGAIEVDGAAREVTEKNYYTITGSAGTVVAYVDDAYFFTEVQNQNSMKLTFGESYLNCFNDCPFSILSYTCGNGECEYLDLTLSDGERRNMSLNNADAYMEVVDVTGLTGGLLDVSGAIKEISEHGYYTVYGNNNAFHLFIRDIYYFTQQTSSVRFYLGETAASCASDCQQVLLYRSCGNAACESMSITLEKDESHEVIINGDPFMIKVLSTTSSTRAVIEVDGVAKEVETGSSYTVTGNVGTIDMRIVHVDHGGEKVTMSVGENAGVCPADC